MRLLKTGPYVPGDEKLEVIQKWGKDIPRYAILSHTWSTSPDEEVLLSDVQNGTCDKKPAYAKLKMAMQRAMFDGYGWLWIDTCCIDKTSSVELTEAINSMYSYYQDSEKCYAYLADVAEERVGEQFGQSRWWKRGWTLQELLAPSSVEFFNSGWRSLGYRDGLHGKIAAASGISQDYLTGELPVGHASIAKRMSWAAMRETTREEDLAYCLIGLFDVNMPMLYGERGIKAFLRLQEEIMRTNEDQSLYSWVKPAGEASSRPAWHGLLADSPKDFVSTGQTMPYTESGDYNPSTMTARGLNITLPLTPKPDGTFVAALHCPVPGHGYQDWLAIYLHPLNTGRFQYARVNCAKLASVSELGQPQRIYVRQHFPSVVAPTVYPYHFLQLRSLRCNSDHPELKEYKIIEAVWSTNMTIAKSSPSTEPKPWSSVRMTYQVDKTPNSLTVALLVERKFDKESFVLLMGANSKAEIAATAFDTPVQLSGFSKMSLHHLSHLFHPEPAPTDKAMDLRFHNLRVNIEERIIQDQKLYYIDIDIHAIARPPAATEILQDAVDYLTGPNRAGVKADVKDKIKRLIPF